MNLVFGDNLLYNLTALVTFLQVVWSAYQKAKDNWKY